MKQKQWRSLSRSLLVLPLALFLITACGEKEPAPKPKTVTPPTKTSTNEVKENTAGKKLFQGCMGCHSIGQGKRVGPDLKNINQRRDRAWLVKWMKDPIGMGQNDPIGKKLLAEYNNIPMANPNLTGQQISDVLDYIKGESLKGVKKQAAFKPITDKAVFEKTRVAYFDRCSGCHGTLRAGATGPSLEDDQRHRTADESNG